MMATPGDLIKSIQANASASATASATALTNLQAYVSGAVAPMQARLTQINNTDLPNANTIKADCLAANPPDTQGATDVGTLITDLGNEATSLTNAIAALNALLPTS